MMNAKAFKGAAPFYFSDEASFSGLEFDSATPLAASAQHAAFATAQEGQLGVIDLEAAGDLKNFARIDAHKGIITDLTFHQLLIATLSVDKTVSNIRKGSSRKFSTIARSSTQVKLWTIEKEIPTWPVATLDNAAGVDRVAWCPMGPFLLAASCGKALHFWDTENTKIIWKHVCLISVFLFR